MGVIYADTAADHDSGHGGDGRNQNHEDFDVANEAMAVVSIFLMAAYGYTTYELGRNRDNVIIKAPVESSK
jgi:hypothetical protein